MLMLFNILVNVLDINILVYLAERCMKIMDVKFYGIELIKDDSCCLRNGNLMWGNFEFVSFKHIEDFPNEYVNKSQNSNKIIYMYSFKDDMKIDLDDSDAICTIFKDIKTNRKYNFVGLTLVSIDEQAKGKIITESNSQTKPFVEQICEYLDASANSYDLNNFDDFIYETFATLNGDDLCFVTLFDDIGTYMQFIENLQTLKYNESSTEKMNLFDAAYSFISSPYLTSNDGLFKECTGYASIQITYNFKQTAQYIIGTILNKLNILDDCGKIMERYKNDVQVYTSLGEYDIVIHLPINILNAGLYTGILHPDNMEFYKPNIEQCHTRFFKKNSLDLEYKRNMSNISDASTNNVNRDKIIKKNMQKLETALGKSKRFNFYNLYNTLSCDFQKASCVVKHDTIMYDDMTMQYQAIIDISCTLIEDYDKNENYIDIYNFALDLIHIFKQTIYRVKQTNMFEKLSAQSLFRDVAVYDKMISCYYYIVKAILSYIYIAGNANQSSLTPFISFEAVPKVTSYLLQVPSQPQEKILSIKLPQESYYKPHKYIPLLFHELGHYINPKNRKTRNMYLFVIIVAVSLQEYLVRTNPALNKSILLQELLSSFIKNLQESQDGITNNYQILETTNKVMFGSTWDEFSNDMICIMKAVLVGKSNKISLKHNNVTNYITDFFNTFTKSKSYQAKDDVDCKYEQWKLTECYLRSVLMGLREALADTFMMYHVRMTLSEYLALTVSVRIDSTFACRDISELSQVRLGAIFTLALCKDLKETDSNLYDVDENISDAQIKSLCSTLSHTTDDEITKYLIIIKQSIRDYQNVWWPMNRLFRKLLNTIIFVDTDDAQKSFKTFWNLLHQDGKLVLDNKKYITWINISLNQSSLRDIQDLIKNKKLPVQTETCEYTKLDNAYIDTGDVVKQMYSIGIPAYTVNALENLIPTLKAVNDVLGNDVLWYRGQASIKWNLKPNMFRATEVCSKAHIECINKEVARLMHEYNDFVALSAESVELTGTIRTEADWLAYMQHYFIGTNFLDWSEQPLTSLYFALENYFVHPCDNSDAELSTCTAISNNSYKDDTVLWVLNPTKMNLLFHRSDIVPNLSIKENADLNKQFLITNAVPHTIEASSECQASDFINKHLPKAITTSRISNHIQAQKGHFVAYDIHFADDNAMDIFSDGDIAYIYKTISNLEECHNTFFKQPEHRYEPFLAKIIIPYHLKEATANYVKQMGVSLSTIYPELKNIGIDITKKFKDKK